MGINLIGKTIKRIEKNYWEGFVIEFTDGTVICLNTYEYPDTGYAGVNIEKINEYNWKEYCKENKLPESHKPEIVFRIDKEKAEKETEDDW